MKNWHVLFALVASALAPAAYGENPCRFAHPKIYRLQKCVTASEFCSSFLGGSATYTYTEHSKATTRVPGPGTGTYVVDDPTGTTYVSTAISTGPPITKTKHVTTTSTFTKTVCPVTDPPDVLQKRVARPSNASCGLAHDADPKSVSSACECYNESYLTKTKTVTRRTPTISTTVTSTYEATFYIGYLTRSTVTVTRTKTESTCVMSPP